MDRSVAARRLLMHPDAKAGDGLRTMRAANRRPTTVLALILAMTSSLTLYAQNDETPYAAARLIGRWRTVMTLALDDARASASEEVTDQMEEFVSPGAVRAARDKASEEQLRQADDALRRFVDAIVKASARQPDGSVIVDPSSIAPAARAICPAYPFC